MDSWYGCAGDIIHSTGMGSLHYNMTCDFSKPVRHLTTSIRGDLALAEEQFLEQPGAEFITYIALDELLYLVAQRGKRVFDSQRRMAACCEGWNRFAGSSAVGVLMYWKGGTSPGWRGPASVSSPVSKLN
jgi:hypothetical protein